MTVVSFTSPGAAVLDTLDRRLLDEHQRGFPICETPFAEIADSLGCQAGEVLRRLAALKRRGLVSRVGPVLTPGRIGASTLAAMAVPPVRIESVAECVNRCPAVNHNYEREHAVNLWFVLTTPCADSLDEALAGIRRRTGLEVLDLRLERAYHIDLGFPLWRRPSAESRDEPAPAAAQAAATPEAPTTPGSPVARGAPAVPVALAVPATPAVPVTSAARATPVASTTPTSSAAVAAGSGSCATATKALDLLDRRLVGAIQDGLPLTARPYAAVAERIGLSEVQVIRRIGRLLCDGVIKRLGVVVRHHELGYRANAMVVFDAPDDRVDALGERLARLAPVTLCYRRTRRPPTWPYNLYCMLHGRDRAEVRGWMDELLPDAVHNLDRVVLFSRRRFRQRGARYAPDWTSTGVEVAVHG